MRGWRVVCATRMGVGVVVSGWRGSVLCIGDEQSVAAMNMKACTSAKGDVGFSENLVGSAFWNDRFEVFLTIIISASCGGFLLLKARVLSNRYDLSES